MREGYTMFNSPAPVSKRWFLITVLLAFVILAAMSGSAFSWLQIMGNGVSRSDREGGSAKAPFIILGRSLD
jgi:hypothetical protein